MDKEDYGYTCKCGKYHKFPAYVIAHWDIELIHTCDCGRKYSILCGIAELIMDENKWHLSP